MTDRLAELASTQAERCLGCAALSGTCDCPRYYGVGPRVDYELWCELLGRFTDEPLFRVWAEAEPQLGVPSWWPSDGRPSTRRYEQTHPAECSCGGCLPSLTEFAASELVEG